MKTHLAPFYFFILILFSCKSFSSEIWDPHLEPDAKIEILGRLSPEDDVFSFLQKVLEEETNSIVIDYLLEILSVHDRQNSLGDLCTLVNLHSRLCAFEEGKAKSKFRPTPLLQFKSLQLKKRVEERLAQEHAYRPTGSFLHD